MYALVAFGDHRAHSQQERAFGRPVTRRAGAVLFTGKHDQRHAISDVFHRSVEDRHGLAIREVPGDAAFRAGGKLVAETDIGEGAAHHHLMIAAARAVGIEVLFRHTMLEHGVPKEDFNSYGSRRGNHEVMVRGTFANVRLRNQLAPGSEGGVTRHFPDGETMSIFDASVKYIAEGVPLIVLAGKEYGSGSSRDWAAKGPLLLGVRAVIAESYERIHRSNLVGM